MSQKSPSTDPFFKGSDLNLTDTVNLVKEGLKGAHYGEFYQEIVESERLTKDKGEYTKIALGNSSAGFGFRIGQDERIAYSYADQLNRENLAKAIANVRPMLDAAARPVTPFPSGRINTPLYTGENPIKSLSPQEKIAILDSIDAFARAQDAGPDASITNVTVNYSAESKSLRVITADGQSLTDNRPTAALQVSVTVMNNTTGEVETGMAMIGGRNGCAEIFNEAAYKKASADALHQARELLRAEDAPAGIMNVVMAPGWPAVILHEAIGHGLEADFNRKGVSVYSGKVGQKIASDEVTVIERGDLPGERGSFPFDDEGSRPRENILIEKGVLKGYINDRQNALLMNEQPTGNGRREDFTFAPMPRMTNTYFANGTHDPDDIVKAAGTGLYIKNMGGGQVDTTSGKFNMNATLSYIIEDGKINWNRPVKGATLVGDGLTVIRSIKMIGNDLEIERSAGVCGKNGQSVPVANGQPTVFVQNMTIGGNKK